MKYPSRGAFVSGCASALAGVAILGSPARAEQFKWKIGHDYPVNASIHVRLVQAVAKIRDNTNGQVDIRVYPDNTLGSGPAMLEQLRVGALEMLGYPGGILDSLVPVSSIESIAFAFPSTQ